MLVVYNATVTNTLASNIDTMKKAEATSMSKDLHSNDVYLALAIARYCEYLCLRDHLYYVYMSTIKRHGVSHYVTSMGKLFCLQFTYSLCDVDHWI